MELTNDLEVLGTDGDRIKVVFVSIDPDRDTQAHLKEYMSSFDPRIVAASGSQESIAAMARAFGAKYRKVPTGSGYTFDHSSAIPLLHRDGEMSAVLDVGKITAPATCQTQGVAALARDRSDTAAPDLKTLTICQALATYKPCFFVPPHPNGFD